MKKIVASMSAILAISTLASGAIAGSNLEVASDSNFSNQTTNFSSDQTIYVRINTDSSGDSKKQLNLRDNQYNFIQSYTLNKSGNTFSTSINAPSREGYYSLEAQIESNGSNTTSVKTIKVGNPNNSNVKVNINNKVNGQTSTNSNTSSPKPSVKQQNKETIEPSPTPIIDNSDVEFEQNVQSQSQTELSFKEKFNRFFTKLWSVIWPF